MNGFGIKVHLDDADEENGTMQIARGSHRAGLVPADVAEQVAERYLVETCSARRGDVLVLKMLTLRASQSAFGGAQRRVLRVDFADRSLPHPLDWMRLDARTLMNP